MWERGAGHADGRQEVDVQRARPLFVGEVEEPGEREVITSAEVVDEQIDATMSLDGGVDEALGTGRTSEVHGNTGRAGNGQLGSNLAGRTDDLDTLVDECLNGGEADATARAHDDRGLARELQIHAALPSVDAHEHVNGHDETVTVAEDHISAASDDLAVRGGHRPPEQGHVS